MNDLALQLLTHSMQTTESEQDSDAPYLWVLDENLTSKDIVHGNALSKAPLTLICNRFDLQQQLASKKIDSTFCDFDFSEHKDNSVEQLFYRISKEKAVVHHIINEAARILKPNGKLVLAGYKNEGIKTYADKAKSLLGGTAEKSKGGQSSHLITLTKGNTDLEKRLDDKDYSTLRSLSIGDQQFLSKPGQFGWNKVDAGSEFLIEHLPALLSKLHKTPQTLLDLGCGYGYLSMMATTLMDCEKSLVDFEKMVATDNNAAALLSCQKNLEYAISQLNTQIQYKVIPDNCAQSIRGRFDLILCNPPFHQGFAVESDLTTLFIEQAHKHLHAKGNALFVVNQFIPLERKATEIFETVSLLAENKSFKLIHCKR